MKVAVVGGTGDFGLALAQQLVAAGHDVVIGSRDAERAAAKAGEVGARGAGNEDAVRDVDLVVLAVKSDAALPTAQSLAAAIVATPVLSVASELRFTKQGVLPGDDALDAGPLASARALEGMTAVIVNLNKRYRGHAGVQITGLP